MKQNPYTLTQPELKEGHLVLMDQLFKRRLPDSLYLDHYTLSQQSPYAPIAWRQYLKDNEHFITSETAAIAEAQARAALSKLGNGANPQEVSAIKALLEKSKLINDAQKQQQSVLLTYLPTKGSLQIEQTAREFIPTIVRLVQSGEYDPQTHTLEWFKEEKEWNDKNEEYRKRYHSEQLEEEI